MIITKIQGGIGNQLFQYAAGKSLANFHSTELILDLTYYNKTRYREYDLDRLNIKSHKKIKNPNELEKILSRNRALSILSFPIKKKYNIYNEPHFYFDKKYYNNPKNCYIKGYWQSELYFQSIKKKIKSEFSLKKSDKLNQSQIYNNIKENNSVGVHIRRGDYVMDKVTNQFHGVLGDSYYVNAVAQIKEKIKNPTFFIFTDDKEWVKKHFQLNIPYTLIHENWHPIYDMFILSKCNHQIIANSTFSWWVAWLNTNIDKVVIAPINWFAKKQYENQLNDLLPSRWVKI